MVGYNVRGILTEDFDSLLRGEGNVILKAQTAEDLSFIPDEHIAAVITDQAKGGKNDGVTTINHRSGTHCWRDCRSFL